MWVFRYFLPAVFAVALGIFVAQNLGERSTVQFLFWNFYDIPLIAIIAITLVIGILIRYYAIFLRWLEKKQLEQTTKKIMEARRSEENLSTKKNYTKEIEKVAEGRMKKRIGEKKKAGMEVGENNED